MTDTITLPGPPRHSHSRQRRRPGRRPRAHRRRPAKLIALLRQILATEQAELDDALTQGILAGPADRALAARSGQAPI
ncbi:hypothetical protein ACWDRB_55100 [Nonomuraea sp. NPDC003707]